MLVNGEDYRLSETVYGKFNNGFARFLYKEVMLNGDFGDAEASDGEGNWVSSYGRHLLVGDDRGFVDHLRCDSADLARAYVREAEQEWNDYVDSATVNSL